MGFNLSPGISLPLFLGLSSLSLFSSPAHSPKPKHPLRQLNAASDNSRRRVRRRTRRKAGQSPALCPRSAPPCAAASASWTVKPRLVKVALCTASLVQPLHFFRLPSRHGLALSNFFIKSCPFFLSQMNPKAGGKRSAMSTHTSYESAFRLCLFQSSAYPTSFLRSRHLPAFGAASGS